MTENFQGQLHHKECKKSKSAKIYTSIRKELEFEKFSKAFCKLFTRQNMQKKTFKTKQMQKIPVTLRKFLNQLKKL